MASSSSGKELSYEELEALRTLNQGVDDVLEESLRLRENLAQTFRRVLPRVLELTGAKAVALTTQNEELLEQTYSHGAFGAALPAKLLAEQPWGASRVDGGTLVTQPLDVVGVKVGVMGLLYEGEHTEPSAAARLLRALETVAEELDTVLASIQTAAEKQALIVELNRCLADRVFEAGMDRAVLALAQRVKLPGFLLLYRDAVEPSSLRYRVYRFGHLEHESNGKRFAPLDELIGAYGVAVAQGSDAKLKQVLGTHRSAETVLISGLGLGSSTTLGKMMVWSEDEGFSAYTMDLLRLLSSALSQRLVDYNRERAHLGQFFASSVIDDLLRDPDYEVLYLSARDEEVGILFADINGFTRICEQVLEKPEKIGQFVDDWSRAVVDLLWEHGGVFDKMVGDCVIGLFGPPFFKSSRLERAEAAVRAARAIQEFTRTKMSAHPEVARISERTKLPGLGVAIGVNLAHAFCGLFGPDRNYTGFSTGMNQTARLQSLGGFRETLVMEPVRSLLEQSKDPTMAALRFGPLEQTEVKNVAQPLRYFRLLDA